MSNTAPEMARRAALAGSACAVTLPGGSTYTTPVYPAAYYPPWPPAGCGHQAVDATTQRLVRLEKQLAALTEELEAIKTRCTA